MTIHLDDSSLRSLKLFVVLSKAYKTVMDRAVKDMKQYGLSSSEFTILELLYTKGKVPLQQIGEKNINYKRKHNLQYRQAGEEGTIETRTVQGGPKGHLCGNYGGGECMV